MRKDIIEKGEVKNSGVQMKKLNGTVFKAKLFSKLNSKKNQVQTIVIDVTELDNPN